MMMAMRKKILIFLIFMSLFNITYQIGSFGRSASRSQNTGRSNRMQAGPTTKAKEGWVYIPVPRYGVVHVQLSDGRQLNLGILNCPKNKLKFSDLRNDLTIKFPAARLDGFYTIVVYKDGYLAKAVGNVKGEDLYEGKLTGYRVADLMVQEESGNDEIYFVEVYQQKKDKFIPRRNYDRKQWNKILKSWDEFLQGTAGKTCFILQSDRSPSTSTINEMTIILQQFDINFDAKRTRRAITSQTSQRIQVFSPRKQVSRGRY